MFQIPVEQRHQATIPNGRTQLPLDGPKITGEENSGIYPQSVCQIPITSQSTTKAHLEVELFLQLVLMRLSLEYTVAPLYLDRDIYMLTYCACASIAYLSGIESASNT